MPRGPRTRSDSGSYHVMLRGVNKQRIFHDLKGVKIIIYKNTETFAAEKYMNIHSDADTSISLSIAGDNRSAIFKLSEENVVIVENAVVMTKNAAFDFGN